MDIRERCKGKQPLALKYRLLILLVVMVLPFVGFSIYKALEIDKRYTEEAQRQNISVAKGVAHEVDEYIGATGDVLISVAESDNIRKQNFTATKPWLDRIIAKYPYYHLIAFVDVLGNVKVASVSDVWSKSEDAQRLAKTLNVSDTACYTRGVVAGDIAVGDFMYSRITGLPVVHVTYPVYDFSGARIGFIAAGLDLTKIQNKILLTDSKDVVISLIDDKGVYIARSREHKKWVGTTIFGDDRFKKMLGKKEGLYDAVSADGTMRMFAFATMKNVPWYARSGIDKDVIHEKVMRDLGYHFAVFIPLLLIAIAGWLWIGRDVNRLHNQTEQLTLRDPLTGLWNHRKLAQDFERELKSARRNRREAACLMVDIDHFKAYNDNNGHQAGDEALCSVANILCCAVRETDFVYRYGGEEFCVLLPDTDKAAASVLAERVRSNVEQTRFEGEESRPSGCLTVSIGVAAYPCDAISKDNLISCADKSLYTAKNDGRNRVAVRCGSATSDLHRVG
ncbi:MAG: GGDEF domain-containing protein [Actinobacteria bacterium]|nr:GGDEF domain-containing protein [Actinomycetota bacterium]